MEATISKGRPLSKEELMNISGSVTDLDQKVEAYAQMLNDNKNVLRSIEDYNWIDISSSGENLFYGAEKKALSAGQIEEHIQQPEEDITTQPLEPEIDLTTERQEQASEFAKLATQLQEQGLMEEFRTLEQQGAFGSLALEESQEKYGISGGMAMFQESQRQQQLGQAKAGIAGQLATLPLQERILEQQEFERLTGFGQATRAGEFEQEFAERLAPIQLKKAELETEQLEYASALYR